MLPDPDDFHKIRVAIASIQGDLSNDAVGNHVAESNEIYAPETHSAALDPNTPIVLGPRGSGKSFWAGVLGRDESRAAAVSAYPRLALNKAKVRFGYTGVGGAEGVSRDQIDEAVTSDYDLKDASAFWWATVLSAAARDEGNTTAQPLDFLESARSWKKRNALLASHEERLLQSNRVLLIVYDALDTIARNWPRRRMLTESLLEVAWALRAYKALKPKLFIRPDQLDDDALRFVELPKLRTGAVRLTWTLTDLYGLFFSRITLAPELDSRNAFNSVLGTKGLRGADRQEVLTRTWSLAANPEDQQRAMSLLAGQYMGKGTYGYKKGNTYNWPFKHLADSFNELTPRSFLGMMKAAATYGPPPQDRAFTAEGMRHGLRAASKTRVDQLHLEFPWIKGVLAPLAGLLLPLPENEVYSVWEKTGTVAALIQDAERTGYLPPFPDEDPEPKDLFTALERIGVMFRRNDDRLDMPDLFRVAARLLKRGGVAPLS